MSVAARLGVLLVAMGALLVMPSRPAQAATVNVAVGDQVYLVWYCNSSYFNGVCPTAVNAGDTVTWNFAGSLSHTTTECGASCDLPTGSPVWDSGLMLGGSYSYTFTQPGVYLYQCGVHGALMRGQITVDAATVGGVASLPDVAEAAPDGTASSARGASRVAGGAAIAGGLVVLAAVTGYARRRLRSGEYGR